MNELIQLALHPFNIVYTMLLMISVLYWLTVIIGVLDINTLDFDLDLDVDSDLEIDADIDADGEMNAAGGIGGILQFFNFGKLPFMLIMTILTLSTWTISMLTNYHLGGSTGFALAMIFPNLFVSLLITKAITTPLIPVFQRLDSGVEPIDYIGKTGRLTIPANTERIGQMEVIVDESPLLVNVIMASQQDESMAKGDEVVILGRSEERACYLIERLKD